MKTEYTHYEHVPYTTGDAWRMLFKLIAYMATATFLIVRIDKINWNL
jgi:hypothetical protein